MTFFGPCHRTRPINLLYWRHDEIDHQSTQIMRRLNGRRACILIPSNILSAPHDHPAHYWLERCSPALPNLGRLDDQGHQPPKDAAACTKAERWEVRGAGHGDRCRRRITRGHRPRTWGRERTFWFHPNRACRASDINDFFFLGVHPDDVRAALRAQLLYGD